jgi:hypothetical protein
MENTTTNCTYTFLQFMQDNFKFNTIAGKDNLLALEDLKDQQKLIIEEVDEITDGLAVNDATDVLDGLIDSYVTLAGLQQKLQNLGIDVNEAMKRIADNNLSKFCDTIQLAKETQLHYIDKGVETFIEYNQIYDKYVVKNTAMKVMKPVGFKSVDLADLIPAELRDGFAKRVLN